MNKLSWLLAGLLIAVVFVSGCTSQSNQSNTSTQEKPTSIISTPKETTKQPIDLVLTLSELTGNYTVVERSPRLRSDILEGSLAWGWKEGYYIRFVRFGENPFSSTILEQWISIYPIENVTKNIESGLKSDENTTYEELPTPNIGDQSRAWRGTTTDEFGNQQRFYTIEFIKMNVYERLDMSGVITDFEELKALATKVAAKIK